MWQCQLGSFTPRDLYIIPRTVILVSHSCWEDGVLIADSCSRLGSQGCPDFWAPVFPGTTSGVCSLASELGRSTKIIYREVKYTGDLPIEDFIGQQFCHQKLRSNHRLATLPHEVPLRNPHISPQVHIFLLGWRSLYCILFFPVLPQEGPLL